MRSADDIESYLVKMEAQYDAVGDGIWVVKDVGTDLVISLADSVAVFRVKVLELETVPAGRREELYRRLLELNAQEMLHGAYGIDQGAVVVTDALQLENLDFNEFQATLDDIGLAVTNHYPELARYASEGRQPVRGA